MGYIILENFNWYHRFIHFCIHVYWWTTIKLISGNYRLNMEGLKKLKTKCVINLSTYFLSIWRKETNEIHERYIIPITANISMHVYWFTCKIHYSILYTIVLINPNVSKTSWASLYVQKCDSSPLCQRRFLDFTFRLRHWVYFLNQLRKMHCDKN